MIAIADENKNLVINGDSISGIKLVEEIRYYDFILINLPSSFESKEISYKEGIGKDWGNLIEQRLSMSKKLMTDSGCIAVYTNNEDYLPIKSVMDKTFGKENYRGSFIQIKPIEGSNNKSIGQRPEFIVVYSKTDKFKYKGSYTDICNEENSGYWKTILECVKYPIRILENEVDFKENLYGWTQERGLRALANYNEYEKKHSNKVTLKQYWEAIHKKFEDENGFKLEFIRTGKNGTIENWINSSDDKIQDTKMVSWISDEIYIKKMYKLEETSNISNSIKIIDMFTDKNSKVLNYCAGMGEIGQAVLELNARDKGNRVVTLITDNKGKFQLDMCYPRMREVCKSYGQELVYVNLE